MRIPSDGGGTDQRDRHRERPEAAIANGVERVVVLSTDKAVYPINAMGISKAMMEKVMVAKSRNLRRPRP